MHFKGMLLWRGKALSFLAKALLNRLFSVFLLAATHCHTIRQLNQSEKDRSANMVLRLYWDSLCPVSEVLQSSQQTGDPSQFFQTGPQIPSINIYIYIYIYMQQNYHNTSGKENKQRVQPSFMAKGLLVWKTM